MPTRQFGFRRNFCTHTKSIRHTFDPLTHQCPCGKFERGFKPAKEFVKPRAECQICERQQAVDSDGTLTNHGYKRPGCGWIQGNCMGHGHQPFPATDALEKWLVAIRDYLKQAEEKLAITPKITTLVYKWQCWRVGPDRGKKFQVNVSRGDESRICQMTREHIPSFETLLDQRTRNLETEIRETENEIKRVVARIEKAKDLMTAKPEAEIPFWEKPCASEGLISYRYQAHPGNWIMIGAVNDSDAISEANRSLGKPSALMENLEKWDGTKYCPAICK